MTTTPSPEGVAQLADALRASRPHLARRSAGDVIASLGAAGQRFLDINDPLRAEALERLPDSSGLSAPMCSAVLDGMAADWTAERLEALVASELGSVAALDDFVAAGPRRVMAVGPTLSVQIAAGGVPGVAVNALLRSLVVKGPTLVKPGRGDVLLPTLFAKALADVDPALSDALGIVYWPGGSEALEDAALGRADVVSVYGSDQTIGALRARLPATARLVAYHHRVSVGVVGRDALTDEGIEAVARRVAVAVATYDQRGCVSPQLIYVEEGGFNSPGDFTLRLSEALGAVEATLPTGPLGTGAASTLQQARGTAELHAASSGGSVRHGKSAAWTVVFEPIPGPLTPVVGRFARIRPIDDATILPGILGPLASHLQTIAVTGLGPRLEEVARGLGETGASRVTSFEDAAFPPTWWHHDGRGPLLDLVRWVDLEV